MKNAWNKLHLASTKATPDVYIKHEFTQTNYTVYLTDLTRIWCENLSRKDALQRAAEIGTSIDPSEDREQLDVLLQKVQDALQNKDRTQTKLVTGSIDSGLQLETSTPLPAPFQPLRWYLKLQQLKEPALTEELLLPLLQDHSGMTADLKALTTSLEEKDHAMSKLLDKMESSGVTFTDIFPSLRSNKKITRSVAQKSVPGLAKFESTKFPWKSETAQLLVGKAGQHSSLLEDVSTFDSNSKLRAAERNWWAKLDHSESSLNGSSLSSSRLRDTSQNETQESEIAFETQTPPPPSRARQVEKPKEPQQLSSSAKLSPQPSKKRLGKIGGPKTSPKPPSEPPESRPSPEQRSPSRDPSVPIEKSPSKTITSPPSKRAGRLGAIGGKKKEKALNPTPEPELEPVLGASPIPNPSPKPKSRLGVIGGKTHPKSKEREHDVETKPPRRTATPEPAAAGVPASKSKSQATAKAESPEPPPEETEEEKANRKRNELKRQLDAKAKAAPAKKRKF